METEQAALPSYVVAMVEDIIQQHGTQLSDLNLANRKAEEASLRRYEAVRWLRKMVGVVIEKDLPAEPSEEEFRIGLRSGIILCNVLNNVRPGSVQRVVEGPCNTVIIPDGAALSAYQYFENVRNFLVAVEEMGVPTFEASDLEQGGKSARVVNCVLALKSYSEWKEGGKIAQWKYSGNSKLPTSGKPFLRKSSEPFADSISRSLSFGDRSIYGFSDSSSHIIMGHDLNQSGLRSSSLRTTVRDLLSHRKEEEVPLIVESMLSKVMEEFECRLASQNHQQLSSTMKGTAASATDNSNAKAGSEDVEMEEAPSQPEAKELNDQKSHYHEESDNEVKMEATSMDGKMEEATTSHEVQKLYEQKYTHEERSDSHLSKQLMLIEQQRSDIHELKDALHQTRTGMQYLQIKYQEDMGNLGKQMQVLSHAASRYKKVLEENRKLYNQIQDLKGNIRVYCRVRPFLPGQPNNMSIINHVEEGNITINTPSKNGKEGQKSFTFNRAFSPSASQEEVFTDTQPLVRSVLDGYNVCIFAYGQTGSGKTFTMTGPDDLTEESSGVNYRALRDLFLLSEQRKDTMCYAISVQMLEIYNEQVRDLLTTDGSNKRLEIRNSAQNGMNVPDANLVPVSSTADVMNLMNLGHRNRTVSATAMNDRSSRSHSCLTVHVQGRDFTSGAIVRSSMHLVDLAGSERVDKSEVTGERLKEAQHINKSLSALGDVISSLASKNAHVPYRNSKLTQLLQDSLGGQAKTLIFVCISPEPEALLETLSTLKFAERVSTIELGAARVNKETPGVKGLKEQISSLKAALARKEGESEEMQNSLSCSPERSSVKPGWRSTGDLSIGLLRSNADDAEDIEVQGKSSGKLKRRSLDPQDIMTSPPSRSLELKRREGDKEPVVNGDWVDKAMFNKDDGNVGEDNLPGSWEADSRQLSSMFGQNCLPDPSKNYQANPLINRKVPLQRKSSQEHDDAQRSRPDTANTDDTDELDVATSDSSETDILCRTNAAKTTNISNESASKGRKSRPRPKSQEVRSMIPSPVPSPARKLSSQSSFKAGRQAGSTDGKRRTGNVK